MTTNSQVEKCLFNSKDDVVLEIIKTISGAKKNIYLMHFWFSWKPIADALINAQKKGVSVNVLTDQRSLVKYMEDENTTHGSSTPEYLFENGIHNIAIYFKKLLHHKVIIVDDVIILGSLNLFKKSIDDHAESIIFIKSEKACDSYKKEFERCFNDALDLENALNTTKYHVKN